MQLQRRDALKVLGGATLATLVDPAFAKAKRLKSAHPRRHRIHRSALRRCADRRRPQDHAVQSRQARSGSARGRRAVVRRSRRADRSRSKAATGMSSSTTPATNPSQVRLTAELLEDHVKHYIFISSIAVYTDFAKAGIDEDYELATLKDPTRRDRDGRDLRRPQSAVREDRRERVRANAAPSSGPPTSPGPATTPIGSPTGRGAFPRAARCSRPVRPTIRFSTSTCAISPTSSAPASRRT